MKNYPRPELRRKNYLILNGEWNFDFDFSNSLLENHPLTSISENVTYHFPKKINRKITVPYPPESELSGIGYKEFIVACWYEKTIKIDENFTNKRVLLHFEAVFHTAHVFVNNKLLCVHKGGYTPFTVDINDFIVNNEVTIKIHTYGDTRNGTQPSGKQSPKNESYGCFYTRSSGIWQTVWLEYVPKTFLKEIFITPDVDNSKVDIKIDLINDDETKVNLYAFYNGQEVGRSGLIAEGNNSRLNSCIKLSKLELWNINNPRLYDLKIQIESKYGIDECWSYFGMRKIEADNKGLKINGKRIFLKFVLDQGYYGKGINTVLDEKDFISDIKRAKQFGFNGARLHQRVFDRRYLYQADKEGFLLWGEYPSWGFDHSSDSSLTYYLPEWLETVKRDYNHPSIITWCIMNENFDYKAKRQNSDFIRNLYFFTKEIDSTRPVVDVSWNYHVLTDIYDVHDYTQNIDEFKQKFQKFEDNTVYDSVTINQKKYANEPYMLSEFGGFKYPDNGEGWGYSSDEIKSSDEFIEKFTSFIKTIYGNPRICGMCYTQLYDVEQEQNGLFFYSRKEKFSEDEIRKMKKYLDLLTEYEKLI